MYRFCILILGILISQTILDAQEMHNPEPASGIVLERTEVRSIHSEIVGRDYTLMISLPRSYSVNDTSGYPVIVLLDPYRSFSIVKGTTEIFITPHGLIPEVIIVGIGYGGEGASALLNWVVGRSDDLTPVKDAEWESGMEGVVARAGFEGVDLETGGAPLFLKALREELLPFIASNYRIDPDQKMLSGYSFGGLFGLYTLFHDPDLFNLYMIGSPSIDFGNGITYDYESDYAAHHQDLNAKVFMSSGELEESTLKAVNKMTQVLLTRHYEHLILNKAIFDDESHVTAYPAALSRGLISLLGS